MLAFDPFPIYHAEFHIPWECGKGVVTKGLRTFCIDLRENENKILAVLLHTNSIYIRQLRGCPIPNMWSEKTVCTVYYRRVKLQLQIQKECGHRKTRLIEGNAKCCHLKKWPAKGLCGRCLFVWGPQPHTPPPLRTVHAYTVYLFTKGRRESWTKEKVTGATVHKAGSKISTWLTVSPVYNLW